MLPFCRTCGIGDEIAQMKCNRPDCPMLGVIPVSDVYFGSDPTAAADTEARLLRAWYEDHRETWWERHTFPGSWQRTGPLADEFMLALMAQARRIMAARAAEDAARGSR